VIAHIVGPGRLPWYAAWLASLAMFGGVLLALVWWRLRTRRRVGLGLMAAGLLANAVVLALQPSVPIAPGYGITLAGARQTTSPVLLRVCATAGATAPALPGNGRLLLVLVDGRQVAELHSDTVALPMSTGRHRVSAQLLTSDHRAFAPAVTTAATVTVTGSGALPATPSC
jgi:hypothetical protein